MRPEVSAYPNEEALEQLLAASPDLLPGASAGPMVVARQVQTGAGPADLVGIGLDGSVLLVECKLRANPEIRRAVVGQLFAYASALWQMPIEDFEQAVADRLGQALPIAPALSRARKLGRTCARLQRKRSATVLALGDAVRSSYLRTLRVIGTRRDRPRAIGSSRDPLDALCHAHAPHPTTLRTQLRWQLGSVRTSEPIDQQPSPYQPTPHHLPSRTSNVSTAWSRSSRPSARAEERTV